MTDELPKDRDASIEALFRVHAYSLLQVAWLLAGDEVIAQEVVLDAFADLRVRGRYRDSFEAVDELRVAVVRGSRGRSPRPAGVLAPLTRKQREVFVLRWWLGLSAQQTGELLRISPRAVDRAAAEARRGLPDEAELAEALEAESTSVELSYDAVDQLRERISVAARRRRRRIGMGMAGAVLVLVAVGIGLWATRPRPYTSPTGRPVFAAVIPVDELATFDVGTGKSRGTVDLAHAEAVASLPGGGWLVSRQAPQCGSILMTVHPDGSVGRLSPPIVDELSGLAVSPDGRRAAGIAVRCPNTRVLGIDVVDLRTGRVTGVWELPTGSTSISGLSWAPDSRRLAYTLGRGVGGQGSGYALLDTSKPGEQLEQVPAPTREVERDGRSCPVLRSVWLGRSGRFAVFAACVDRNELLLVQQRPDPNSALQGTVLATLPDSALTLGLDAVATDDGRHLLVTTDVATYRIDGSHVSRLADARPSPAW
jgi:hypothetical protein